MSSIMFVLFSACSRREGVLGITIIIIIIIIIIINRPKRLLSFSTPVDRTHNVSSYAVILALGTLYSIWMLELYLYKYHIYYIFA